MQLIDVVTLLLLRAGLTAGQFDVSELSTIEKPLRSLIIGQVAATRATLDMLATCYFFGWTGGDKLYARLRGSSPVATIPWTDLGADGSNRPFRPRIAGELEMPAQIAFTYDSVENDYQSNTVYSDRLLSSQKSTETVEAALGFTAQEAKQIVDAILLDKVMSLSTESIAVDRRYSALQPCDVVLIEEEDGSTWRMRIVRIQDDAGVRRMDLVMDDASVFVQAGIATAGTQSQSIVLPLPDTEFLLLDIPLLRDADDHPGHYVAVNGGGADNWTNAALYSSPDDVVYTLAAGVATEAVIGLTTTALDDWTGGNVWDETGSVTVEVAGQLYSATAADVLARRSTNAILIGNELLQFRDAALVSAGVYTLTGLLRGRRGTEWAMAGHAIGDRVCLLGNAGMRYLPLQTSELGVLRYVKAVSAGQRLSAATEQSITPLGASLAPLSPVLASADRSTSDTILSWFRRTRLSTRITGPLPWSNPLGEASEAYEVDVFSDGTYTTLVRTLSAVDTQATYTGAQQTTDFGAPQSTLYLDIYQLSATVGRGRALRAAV